MSKVKITDQAPMVIEDPRFMTSLARGLEVLRAFEGKSSLTVSDASKAKGLSRSSAARCLYTLERLGYVAAVGPSYRLRPAILPLARAYIHSDPLAVAGQSAIDFVRDQLKESSSMAVFDSPIANVVYVCRSETARIIAAPLLIGSTLPSYCTSMGRVLLAGLEDDQLTSFLSSDSFAKRTPKTIADRKGLAEDIARVRERGWSVIDEELEPGLRSIAVPVRGADGGVLSALNVGAPTSRRTVAWLIDVALPALQAAAAHLSRLQCQ